MKTRMRRGSKTKEIDPDYWETSKPIKKMECLRKRETIQLRKMLCI